jgi:hypothetical protein
VHAAPREQRDAGVADKPCNSLREVARVGVLGDEDHERPVELHVQRREQERQRRLGDARRRGERFGKRAEAVALAHLVDKGMKDRTVHDERPNHGVRPFDRSLAS